MKCIVVGLSALALSFLMVAPAEADTNTTICRMDYTMKGWSAFYKTARGSGTITCDDGQSASVKLKATGGGMTAGKFNIREGSGRFSEVTSIRELFGSYATASAAAGAVHSSEAQAMTKGDVSLALAGNGTGIELGVSFGKFTITQR
jgi:hypothetical protein